MIEIQKTNTNKLNFVVKSKSGRTLLQSVEFTNEGEIERTVQLLKAVGNSSNRVERKTNFDGKFLFDLKNNSGETIGSSGLYSSEAGMENGIKNLKRVFNQIG